MGRNILSRKPMDEVIRLLTAFVLLVVAFGANADDCLTLYSKSGATPGTKTCRLDVVSNTPGGMGNYACINDLALIDQWCSTPAVELPESSCPVADPVYPGNGSVTLSENDFVSGDDNPMRFVRTYRSRSIGASAATLGSAWFHGWQRQLGLANANNGSSSKVVAYREDGEPVTFNWSAGTWRVSGNVGLGLAQDASGWTLVNQASGTTEKYSAQGLLLSESTRAGFIRTLIYGSSGLLTEVNQHAAGTSASNDLALRLEYDDKHRISRLIEPVGGMTQYAYDSNSNLVSVTWPDGYVRRYIYDDVRFRNAITGEVDETGARVATWTYDAQGRASAVNHPDMTRNVRFAYSGNQTTVTDSQRTTTVKFAPVAGLLRPTGTSSLSRVTNTSWDAFGNVLSETNPTGGTNEFSYDSSGRTVRLVVRNASSATVTTVRYADATSLSASMVASPGKVRAFAYDAKGNVTGVSEFATNDPTGERGFDAKPSGTQRTVGIRYDGSNRIVAALEYLNGTQTSDWFYAYDETGNLRVANDNLSGWTLGAMRRDAAHRATYLAGDNREALVTYNSRGWITQFIYNEYPTALNGSLYRILTVDYRYSADGQVTSRTGTVRQNNGGSTSLGVAQPASSDELNQWLNNVEDGAILAGPPVNRGGLLRSMLGAPPEPGLVRLCIECMFNPALSWGWALTSDNTDPFGIIGMAGGVRSGLDAVAKLCKPTANQLHSVFEKKIVGQMKKRGWTAEEVESTIANPYRTIPARDTRALESGNGARRDDPATAYIREDGHYVVRNDVDGTVVQVSDRRDADWKSHF
ncbi:colicin E5-related ribonuclease [Paraburkholderia bryophila]|uniref:YD repeat-containing protein n=1 Tax=Paraburkholderia bryophila TaxID=420952 RepID=A0A7Y9WDZ6_9BURK|nr:colicin E5-related ribonuclease [Paraburkholderia bryophila]NYH18493.1 YD repeat-containing protein [Paraburkholderia bryophila]